MFFKNFLIFLILKIIFFLFFLFYSLKRCLEITNFLISNNQVSQINFLNKSPNILKIFLFLLYYSLNFLKFRLPLKYTPLFF